MALSTCSVLFLTTSACTRNLKVSCNLYGTRHGLPIGLLSRKNVISKIMVFLLKYLELFISGVILQSDSH